MAIYVNDNGEYSTLPLAAADGDTPVHWVELEGDERIRQELNALKADRDFAKREIVLRNERINSLERDHEAIQDHLNERVSEGYELLNVKDFAKKFDFNIQVTKEFTINIQVEGTVTFNLGDEPDLNNMNIDVDVDSYYDEEVEVNDVTVTDSELKE